MSTLEQNQATWRRKNEPLGRIYPWTVIPVEHHADYMAALETASVDKNIVPFTEFIAKLMEKA